MNRGEVIFVSSLAGLAIFAAVCAVLPRQISGWLVGGFLALSGVVYAASVIVWLWGGGKNLNQYPKSGAELLEESRTKSTPLGG